MPKSKTSPETQDFAELAENLAHALANIIECPQCPEYLRVKIEELHKGLAQEFDCELAHDIRLRFALAARYAANGQRPA